MKDAPYLAKKAILANVLIVDDHPENRAALKAILSSPDYRIVEAGSSADALLHLLDEEFAVLLIDVVMPGMSGFELATAIKERARTAAVPIVFLTAQATDVDLVYKAYSVGAVDYLVKPLAPEMVRAKVAVFAELYRQRKRIEEQANLLVYAERQVSELRLADLRLAEERRYRTLAEAVPHIVWTARPDGVVDYFNHRWFEYTGCSAAQAEGSWEGVVHPDDLPRSRSEWNAAVRSGQMFEAECRLRRSIDGSYRWHLARAVPERSVTGQVVSWLGTFTDIEDQKRAQVERDLLYREAVDAVRARDEFLSIASHELRTPLSSLKLQIEMLLRPPRRDPGAVLSPEQTRAKLENASKQIDRLSKLIAELMDLSKLTSGHLKLDFEECDLADIVRDVTQRLGDEAARAQSSIEVRARAPIIGTWDRTRVEQVVMNLLTNALKFGGGKAVEVSLDDDGPLARLVVRDHGIGIAPEDADRIFHRYEQAISSRSYGGMGLGLYIVSQIVKSHAGTIRVESQPGAGSAFIVELPRRPEPIQKETHAASDDGERKRERGEAYPDR